MRLQTSKDIENAKAKGLPVPAMQLKIEIPANRQAPALEVL